LLLSTGGWRNALAGSIKTGIIVPFVYGVTSKNFEEEAKLAAKKKEEDDTPKKEDSRR
jgi:hypothetical protein